MNKTRRKQLTTALEQLREVRDQVKDILDNENDAYDNMGPRQGSEKGEESISAIHEMEAALKAIAVAGKAIKKAMA